MSGLRFEPGGPGAPWEVRSPRPCLVPPRSTSLPVQRGPDGPRGDPSGRTSLILRPNTVVRPPPLRCEVVGGGVTSRERATRHGTPTPCSGGRAEAQWLAGGSGATDLRGRGVVRRTRTETRQSLFPRASLTRLFPRRRARTVVPDTRQVTCDLVCKLRSVHPQVGTQERSLSLLSERT